ncbi:MAG: thiamine phosphate synthase [Betaproteobacteria bacterium]|nr:thiamine phosphate synthase [Betaproteobacteria bacterium]
MEVWPELPLVAASCHHAAELARAAALELDFAVLGTVRDTLSHPGIGGLGWKRFAQLLENMPLPVFALGGMRRRIWTPRSRPAHARYRAIGRPRGVGLSYCCSSGSGLLCFGHAIPSAAQAPRSTLRQRSEQKGRKARPESTAPACRSRQMTMRGAGVFVTSPSKQNLQVAEGKVEEWRNASTGAVFRLHVSSWLPVWLPIELALLRILPVSALLDNRIDLIRPVLSETCRALRILDQSFLVFGKPNQQESAAVVFRCDKCFRHRATRLGITQIEPALDLEVEGLGWTDEPVFEARIDVPIQWRGHQKRSPVAGNSGFLSAQPNSMLVCG